MERNQLLLSDAVNEARAIVSEARDAGINLKLLGGVGIRLLTSSWRNKPFNRAVSDIDIACRRGELPSLLSFFKWKGFREREVFNKLNMGSRLIYYTPTGRKVDVFVEEFRMCHRIPLKRAFDSSGLTIPAAELLLTKLQVVKTAEKDLVDICLMMNDLAVTHDDTGINVKVVADICSRDWGLYTTAIGNIEKTATFLSSLPSENREKVKEAYKKILSSIVSTEKAIGWKARSIIGKRFRWYQEPDEVPEL